MGGEVCTDNRFEIIAAYKKKLIESTNIQSCPEEMAVIDDILFRFWQMDWLPPIPHGDLIDASKLVELCDIMADKSNSTGVSISHQFKTAVEWSPIVIPAEEEK